MDQLRTSLASPTAVFAFIARRPPHPPSLTPPVPATAPTAPRPPLYPFTAYREHPRTVPVPPATLNAQIERVGELELISTDGEETH